MARINRWSRVSPPLLFSTGSQMQLGAGVKKRDAASHKTTVSSRSRTQCGENAMRLQKHFLASRAVAESSGASAADTLTVIGARWHTKVGV